MSEMLFFMGVYNIMANYISKPSVNVIIVNYMLRYDNEDYNYDIISALRDVSAKINEAPSADVQPVNKITKIIQARLNGVQKVKIDAMLSGDSNTAYKMVGAEEVCNAILQDLEAIIMRDE